MEKEQIKILKKEMINEIRLEMYKYTRYPIIMQTETSLLIGRTLMKFENKVEKIINQKLK